MVKPTKNVGVGRYTIKVMTPSKKVCGTTSDSYGDKYRIYCSAKPLKTGKPGTEIWVDAYDGQNGDSPLYKPNSKHDRCGGQEFKNNTRDGDSSLRLSIYLGRVNKVTCFNYNQHTNDYRGTFVFSTSNLEANKQDGKDLYYYCNPPSKKVCLASGYGRIDMPMLNKTQTKEFKLAAPPRSYGDCGRGGEYFACQ